MTPKQQKFVEEYLVDLNATQAAIRAGYSAKTAKAIGSQNLTKVDVQAAIQELQQKHSKGTNITRERVLAELAKIAFSNMQEFADWSGGSMSLVDSKTLTPEQCACVSELAETTTQTGGSIRFKLHNKVDALEKLGKHLGLFDIERFKHERDMATLDRNALTDAIKEIPALGYFEHPPAKTKDDSTAD